MIKSMTGFGRAEIKNRDFEISVEVKAVNHRYSDIYIRLPKIYNFAEDVLRKAVKKTVKRGKVEIYIRIEYLNEQDSLIKLSKPLAKQYYDRLTELKEFLGIEGEINLALIAKFPEVLKADDVLSDEDEIVEGMLQATEKALEKFDEMRIVEGEKLAADILKRANIISETVDEIEKLSPIIVAEHNNKWQKRIKELTEHIIQEERIATEAAIFADKACVTEEIVRLRSHISQLKKIIETANQPEGKKLDFLMQEMNREANTIASKANDISIINATIEAKSEIEKIREQVQNIE